MHMVYLFLWNILPAEQKVTEVADKGWIVKLINHQGIRKVSQTPRNPEQQTAVCAVCTLHGSNNGVGSVRHKEEIVSYTRVHHEYSQASGKCNGYIYIG